MKKSLTILFSLISALMFVSCFEMKQEISYKKGIYNYSIEFTVDKTVLAMLGENTSIDSEELLGSVDSEDFTVSPEKIRIEKVNTETHEGSRFLFSIDEKTTDTLAQIFLPVKNGKSIELFIFYPEMFEDRFDPDSSDGKKIKALLSRAKWSFVVNKSVMKKIKKAVIVDTENNKELECKVRKEGKNHIIELPVVELLQDGNSYTKLIISK